MTVKDLLKNPDRKFNAAELAALAAEFRLESWDVLHQRGTGHWGGTASAMELTTSLYFNRLNIRTNEPLWEDRDRFILSKGHASMNLYTVLGNRGYFPVKDLPTFRTLGSKLQGHPAMNKLSGVDMSTGALGHGLSIGLGMAMAAKLSNKDYWTYVLTGEGCLNEQARCLPPRRHRSATSWSRSPIRRTHRRSSSTPSHVRCKHIARTPLREGMEEILLSCASWLYSFFSPRRRHSPLPTHI